MADELVLTNARLVLADRIVTGSICIRDGVITALDEGPARGIDCEGDLIIPGLVELHTDQVEAHYTPRPGVRWPAPFAIQAHDAQVIGSGITTVFDALCLGVGEQRLSSADLRELVATTTAVQRDGHLKAEHFTHLRCETSSQDITEAICFFEGDPSVRLASLMDHAPGQRQFVSLEKHREYYQGAYGMCDAEYEKFVGDRQAQSLKLGPPNRAAVVAYCQANDIMLASHDDATTDHVAEAIDDGVRIAEFPTTHEAAGASHAAGMAVLMGAPNLVRGQSHSGNIGARELAAAGHLDILSSDYVLLSLLQAAFLLPQLGLGYDLPRAIALVTRNPAEAVGLSDRGQLSLGRRGDLVRLREAPHGPVVKAVWREGARVA
ncbi:MAG: alpha-D-ribose 1-methylphosphonate 5-triphosphate diphosphatase [Pseudomonadota bacterium]